MNHKVSLRVGAHGAHFGGFFADVDVAAVGAFPHNDTGFFEHFLGFHIVQELAVAFFVHFFDFAYSFNELSQFVETFFFGFFSEGGVHIGPFVVFAVGGI